MPDGLPARRFPVVNVLLIVANFAAWLFLAARPVSGVLRTLWCLGTNVPTIGQGLARVTAGAITSVLQACVSVGVGVRVFSGYWSGGLNEA